LDAVASDKTASVRLQTAREEEIVAESLRDFQAKQLDRATFGSQWEEISELIDPISRNTFFYGNYNWPGQKKTDRQVDATGMMALYRFAAICNSLITPRNMIWHGLEADNDYVMKQRGVRLYFEQTNRVLFSRRYKASANFSGQNHSNFRNLGAYGTCGMFIDQLDPAYGPGIRYRAVNLGELFIGQNHQGLADSFCRWFKLNARQCAQRWGEENLPPQLCSAYESNSEILYDFLHRVCPRTDYDPERFDYKGMPFASYYICLASRSLMSEGGYRTLPIAISRYDQAPQETYGRGPAGMVLPALKTLNAEKRMFLKQGHRAADPVLLAADDGIMSFDMRPGALNKGGVNADGKLLVNVLPTGNIQVSKEMMQEERTLINDAFLVTLFQILTETPTMTATEVIERTAEKGILIAPSMTRQQDEYCAPLVDRELDVLGAQRLLPPMPPVLREAKGEYRVSFTNPLARAQKAQEAAGFMRTVETVKELVQITQDPSLLDPFNFDVAVPAIAEIQAVPPSWMSSDEEIAGKRKNRQQAMQRKEQLAALPNQAAMLKATAVAQKAGMQVQQPGAMPQQGQPQQMGM